PRRLWWPTPAPSRTGTSQVPKGIRLPPSGAVPECELASKLPSQGRRAVLHGESKSDAGSKSTAARKAFGTPSVAPRPVTPEVAGSSPVARARSHMRAQGAPAPSLAWHAPESRGLASRQTFACGRSPAVRSAVLNDRLAEGEQRPPGSIAHLGEHAVQGAGAEVHAPA